MSTGIKMTDVTIQLSSPARTFLFDVVSPYDDETKQNVVEFNIASTSETASKLFRFSGKAGTHNFDFVLINDGSDKSNGTHTSTVITVNQQIAYLKDVIFSPSFSVYWTLTQTRHAPSGIVGVITNLKIKSPPGSSSFAIGSFEFKIGTVVGV